MSPLAAVLVGLAFAVLVIGGAGLAIVDIRTHRLPNRWVLAGYAIVAVLFTAAAAIDHDGGRLLRAVLAGAVVFAIFFATRIVSPRAVGGGDVKLAGLLGLCLGWIGWSAVVIGFAAGFLLGGVWALVLVARRRADRSTRIAFGPFLIAGAWVGAALGALGV